MKLRGHIFLRQVPSQQTALSSALPIVLSRDTCCLHVFLASQVASDLQSF